MLLRRSKQHRARTSATIGIDIEGKQHGILGRSKAGKTSCTLRHEHRFATIRHCLPEVVGNAARDPWLDRLPTVGAGAQAPRRGLMKGADRGGIFECRPSDEKSLR